MTDRVAPLEKDSPTRSALLDHDGEIEGIVQEWRVKALYALLVVIAVLGLPAYLLPVWNAIRYGEAGPILWVYVTVYLSLVGLAAFPRLDYRLRSIAFFLLAYINAIASFARLGLVGSGRLYLVILPLIAVLLVGTRAGYLTASLSLAIYAAFAYLAHTGFLSNWLTLPATPLDLAYWTETGFAMALFLILVLVLQERFYIFLLSTLAARKHANAELEKTAQVLKASEERLAFVMQGSNDGIWDWDIRKGEVYYSPRWKSMLGYSGEEIGCHFSDWHRLVHPDDQEGALAVIKAHLESAGPYFKLEHRLMHKDGSFRWILARGYTLRDSSGNPYRMVGSHTDITERIQVEEDIRRQNEYLAALHDTALGIIGRLEVTELLETIIERANHLMGASYGWVYLLQPGPTGLQGIPEKKVLEIKVATGLFHKYVGSSLKRGEGLSGKIWETGQPMAIEDYQSWPFRSLIFEDDLVGPAIGAPLKSGSEVIGVIGLSRAPGDPSFRPDDLDRMSRFAHLASIALENARLHTSLQDELVERKQAEKALREAERTVEERLAFEKLVGSISTEFINLGPNEIDAGIQHALEAIGGYVEADRSYVFLFSEDGTRMTNTHEWCAPGIQPQRERMQDQLVAIAPWCIEKVKQLEVVRIPCVSAQLGEDAQDRAAWPTRSIQSLVVVPMVYQGAAVGFVGFDSVLSQRTWNDESISLLRIVGEMFVNALEHQRAQAIQNGQRQFLELLATGGGFSETLHTLVQMIEGQSPGMLGLILLLDDDGRYLHIGASVSLPQDYIQSIEGLEIGPLVGSCGTACYTGERVIVEDISTDPRWDGLRDLAVRYGLRACWSEPVFSSGGKVVGTFAMYFHQPRSPSRSELHTIETAAHLVGIAVEHRHSEEALRNSELRFRAVFEGAPIGISITSLEARLVESNRALQQMFGYTGEEFYNLSVPEFTHPDDMARDADLFFNELVPGKRDFYQLEKRFIRKSGEVFWGRLSLSLARGSQGEPLFAIATTEDITEQKQAAEELAQAYQTLERRVEERTRELAVLNAISTAVNRSLDLREVMNESLDRILGVMGLELGVAYRASRAANAPGDDGSLELLAYRGLSGAFIDVAKHLPLEGSMVKRSAASGQPLVWLPEEYPNPRIRRAIEGEGAQLAITVPLLVKDRLVGALVLGSLQARPVSSEELALLAAIGQQVSVAVENARLHEGAQKTAILEERGRLARELHDSVTQSLYSVTLYAEAAARLLAAGENITASEHLRELRDTAQEALREMRLLIYELRPLALEKSSLVEALHTRMEAVEARSGIKTELNIDGQEELSYTMKVELYQIIQETLNNVLKHARASRVQVSLCFSETATSLEVIDDGIGFVLEQATSSGGLGLAGIAERAERIGGKLQVESIPGKGTRVFVEVLHGVRHNGQNGFQSSTRMRIAGQSDNFEQEE